MEEKKSLKVLSFPAPEQKKSSKRERVRKVDGVKYFNSTQVRTLRRRVRDRAELSLKNKQITGIREWMVVDLLTSTGLRVSEAANLRCGDLKIGYSEAKIYVREGKGGISGHIVINDSLKRHLRQFLSWKQGIGEPIGDNDFLFLGQRGPWTAQAIQQIVKKFLRELGLYEKGKSVHALRHSYAVELYSKEKDLRAVQKQLRHVSIQSTLVYADITDESISDQIKGLWN